MPKETYLEYDEKIPFVSVEDEGGGKTLYLVLSDKRRIKVKDPTVAAHILFTALVAPRPKVMDLVLTRLLESKGLAEAHAKLKLDFYSYLANIFGEEFPQLIEPPEWARVGERVLYLLKHDEVARRREMNQADVDEFHRMLAHISQKTGGKVASVKLPVTSGLPYPRAVDIADWAEVALGNSAERYLESGELLPKPDFSIMWLFGTVFWNWSKQLVYIDFMHPRVKAVFSVEYDVEGDHNAGRDMARQFKKFNTKRVDLIRNVDSNSDVIWAKLLQLDDEFHTRIKTR